MNEVVIMREEIIDLHGVPNREELVRAPEFWADHPARNQVEDLFLDFAGRKVRVRITVCRE